jgi:hypothetical protein
VNCFETDVSEKPVDPHLQGSSYLHSLILEDGTIGCPETLVSNHFTPHVPEDEKFQFNRS